jgi:hypothetical protein
VVPLLSAALAPPPTATQKVSEMHDSEVNPPPGGSVVRDPVHPGARATGATTVVGVAEGRVVVGAGTVVLVAGLFDRVVPWRAAVGATDACVEQAAAVIISAAQDTPAANRLSATCPPHVGSTALTDLQG